MPTSAEIIQQAKTEEALILVGSISMAVEVLQARVRDASIQQRLVRIAAQCARLRQAIQATQHWTILEGITAIDQEVVALVYAIGRIRQHRGENVRELKSIKEALWSLYVQTLMRIEETEHGRTTRSWIFAHHE
jgi:hypothetical protein